MSIVSGMINSGEWIKGKEFETALTVKFLSVTKVQSNDPKYGDEQGMTNRYELEVDGMKRTFDNKGIRLLRAVDGADVDAGDMAIMKRSGAGTDTMWTVEKLGADKGEVAPADDIPFTG